MNLKKIGDVNFEEFKTEFFLTKRVEDYLKKKKISLTSLIPDGWFWYTVTLFDLIGGDKEGISNEKFRKKFKVIYNGAIEKRGPKNKKVFEEVFCEDILITKKKIVSEGGALGVKSLNGKDYLIKYIILKK